MAGSSELNLKISSILAISIFMSILNFMLSLGEHEKSFKTSALYFCTDLYNFIYATIQL